MNTLRCFEAVARLGSVTEAAAHLHVTHSAVSQQIRLLEGWLGKTLFLRQGRGLQLTENGRLYALHVRGILLELDEATRLARGRSDGDELVIATLPSFGQHWLMPRLPRFQALQPELRVRLQVGLELSALEQGVADIGIRMGLGSWNGLDSEHLFDDEWVVVAAPGFNQGRLPHSDAEIVRMPMIRSDESWQDWCRVAEVPLPPAGSGLWVNDSNLVIDAVRRGQGLALERLSLVHGLLREGALVKFSPTHAPYTYAYWLVRPTHAALHGKTEAFERWLREEVDFYRRDLA